MIETVVTAVLGAGFMQLLIFLLRRRVDAASTLSTSAQSLGTAASSAVTVLQLAMDRQEAEMRSQAKRCAEVEEQMKEAQSMAEQAKEEVRRLQYQVWQSKQETSQALADAIERADYYERRATTLQREIDRLAEEMSDIRGVLTETLSLRALLGEQRRHAPPDAAQEQGE